MNGIKTHVFDFTEYCDLRVRRQSDYDLYYSGEVAIYCNDDLPEGAPPFYREVEE